MQLSETDVKHLKSKLIRTITNIAEKEYTSYGKIKKEFLCKCISNIANSFFIDTEELSKMSISSQVFFNNFVDRFKTTCLKKWISLKVFFKNFAGRFQNSNLSKNWIISKVFFKDFDDRFENFYNKKINLKVH